MTVTLITLAVLGFALNALLCAVEVALINADTNRVEGPRARVVLSEAASVLRVAATLRPAGLFLAVASLLLLAGDQPLAIASALVISIAVGLVICTALPRNLVAPRSERFLEASGLALHAGLLALAPLDVILRALSRIVETVLGQATLSESQTVSRQRVKEILEDEEDEEEIDPTERLMIRRIMALDETEVAEIMTPLNRVVALSESELSWPRLRDIAESTGHSRIPIYRGYILQIIGHIDLYDLCGDGMWTPESLRDKIQPPHYVPESKFVDDLLQEFLRDRRRLAIVIDEHGACSGVVTREDILEEIFGEIADEFDRENPLWEEEAGGSVLFDASADIDDVNAHFGLAIPTDRSDTLAGFICERLGRVPRRGEAVRHRGHTLRVVEMKHPQIVKIRLERALDDAQRPDPARP